MKDSRKLIGKIIALTMAVSLLPSCSVKESQTTTPSESVTTEAPTTSETTTVPETTETQDLNETLPTTTKVPLDVIEGDKGYFTFGFAVLGFDNPEIEKVLRELTGDENITFYDVGYLPAIAKRKNKWDNRPIYEDYENNRYGVYDDEDLKKELRKFWDGLFFYTLKKLDRRYIVDEIPYSFFEEYFPDYLEMCKTSEVDGNMTPGIVNKEILMYTGAMNDYMRSPDTELELFPYVRSADVDKVIEVLKQDEKLKESIRCCMFIVYTEYNSFRISMLYGSPKTVQQGRTIDGRNALILSNSKIELLMLDTHRVPYLRGIEDFYKPIDSEILKAGGIDEATYERLFDFLIKDHIEAKPVEPTS